MISCEGYSVKSSKADGSASLIFSGERLIINCNQESEVGLPLKGLKSVTLEKDQEKTRLKTKKTGNGIIFNVPEGESIIIF